MISPSSPGSRPQLSPQRTYGRAPSQDDAKITEALLVFTSGPKPGARRSHEALTHIGGCPFVVHVLRLLAKSGVVRVVVVVHQNTEGLVAVVQSACPEGVQLEIVQAESELGLSRGDDISYAQGVLAARSKFCSNPFLLVSTAHLFCQPLVESMQRALLAVGTDGPVSVILAETCHQEHVRAVPTCARLRFQQDWTTDGKTPIKVQNAGRGLTEFDAVDAGLFAFSPRVIFDTIDELIQQRHGRIPSKEDASSPSATNGQRRGYISFADALNALATSGRGEVLLTSGLPWYCVEEAGRANRLQQLVDETSNFPGAQMSTTRVHRSSLLDNAKRSLGCDFDMVLSNPADDPVLGFLERMGKLAEFEQSLPGISLPASLLYISDIRPLLWRHTLCFARAACLSDAVEPSLSRQNSDCGSQFSKGESSLKALTSLLRVLGAIQQYFAYPAADFFPYCDNLFQRGELKKLFEILSLAHGSVGVCDVGPTLSELLRLLETGDSVLPKSNGKGKGVAGTSRKDNGHMACYFEVVVVGSMTAQQESEMHDLLKNNQSRSDSSFYSLVVVPSFEDALACVLFNHSVQAVLLTQDIDFHSKNELKDIQSFLGDTEAKRLKAMIDGSHDGSTLVSLLAQKIHELRPSLDIFYVSDNMQIGWVDTCHFNRVFHSVEQESLELHLSILQAVQDRAKTPFFSALMTYASRPTGVFHALPLSRGSSIYHSQWIHDFGEFYGQNIFLAETSSTIGGLDSLLAPTGIIKTAQEMAAKTFGAQQTFFSTNGTSTANKVVLQALTSPGDIVLVDRNCHKSHHYGAVLQGAMVVYLEAYPVNKYALYGTVPCNTVVDALLAHKAAGTLDRVKLVLLTNCTFDGLVYNVEQLMERCLAIKPDLVFIWDEAWFAFAYFSPTYRRRTGMHCARVLRDRYRSAEYRSEYERATEGTLPDPDKVVVRVYATQSTHKTLSAFRQGSMIHIFDELFEACVEQPFHESYMTHTSTSPNYQIIASLDVARRQMSMEGFTLVQTSVQRAMVLRRTLQQDPLLLQYFRFLDVVDLVPSNLRSPGAEFAYDPAAGFSGLDNVWARDEVVLDPTRLTLFVGRTGLDGDSFKRLLMDEHQIQVNKTSINTVLFMTNIGTTASAVAHLHSSLYKIALKLDNKLQRTGRINDKSQHCRRVEELQRGLPPLPDFSGFHPAFKMSNVSSTGLAEKYTPGNMRRAYFEAYKEENIEYLMWDEIERRISNDQPVVGATFIIPYPPGFPVVVPGQSISMNIITFMKALDVSEVHGFVVGAGVQVFKEEALRSFSGDVSKICSRVAALEGAAPMNQVPEEEIADALREKVARLEARIALLEGSNDKTVAGAAGGS